MPKQMKTNPVREFFLMGDITPIRVAQHVLALPIGTLRALDNVMLFVLIVAKEPRKKVNILQENFDDLTLPSAHHAFGTLKQILIKRFMTRESRGDMPTK